MDQMTYTLAVVTASITFVCHFTAIVNYIEIYMLKCKFLGGFLQLMNIETFQIYN